MRGVASLPGLQEKQPGVFYREGKAFLHFHEDPAGLFADLRVGDAWERIEVTSEGQRFDLMRRLMSR